MSDAHISKELANVLIGLEVGLHVRHTILVPILHLDVRPARYGILVQHIHVHVRHIIVVRVELAVVAMAKKMF